MFIFSNHPQSIWRIIANSFRLYRASISKIWYWQLIFVLATVLAIAPFGPLHVWINPSSTTFFVSGHIISSIVITSAACFFLLAALFTLVMGQCFIYSRMEAVATGGDTHIKTSMRLAFKKTPRVLAAIFILLLVIASVFVSIALLESAVMKIVPFGNLIGLASIIIMYTLTITMGIFTVLSPLFILIDNNGVFRSLKNSVTYMRKNFWRALGLFMLVSLASIIIVPAVLLSTAKLLLALPQSPPILSTIGTLSFLAVYAFVYAFATPIFNTLLLTFYHDVKVRYAHHL